MAAARVTMADVAREAKVSNATVSRILEGTVPVSAQTKTRVLNAIEKMGYIRNEAATRLAKGTSDTVGLLMGDPTNPYYGRLHYEFQLRTAEHRLQLLTAAPSQGVGSANQRFSLQRMLEQRVGGIIIASGSISPQELLPMISTVPTVVVGRPEDHSSLNTVSHDETANGHLAADEVVACGHTAVAVVDPVNVLVEHRRAAAMIERLQSRGVHVISVKTEATTSLGSEHTNATVLRLAKTEAVTAAMFPADMRLLAFLQAAQRADLRVPGDISASGIDGVLPGLELLGLATVRLPIETLVRRGMEILWEQMSNNHRAEIQHESHLGTFVPGRTLARRA
jgi:DNA-binding LacI/PurR family transcriptional regulator